MAISIEIKRVDISSRTERREDRAHIFDGTVTMEVSGLNGSMEIAVKFKNAVGLDEACLNAYSNLAQWGAEVAAVAQTAAGEPS